MAQVAQVAALAYLCAEGRGGSLHRELLIAGATQLGTTISAKFSSIATTIAGAGN